VWNQLQPDKPAIAAKITMVLRKIGVRFTGGILGQKRNGLAAYAASLRRT
jgi:hypothetical protein